MLYKAKYRATSNEFRHLVTEFEKEKELNIIKANNVGYFYKYTNKKLNNSKGISPLIDANDKLLIDDLDKATVLNMFLVPSVLQTTADNPLVHNRLLRTP